MKRIRFGMVFVLAFSVLAGCASTSDNGQWLALEQARQARMDTIAAQCETDLCLVMVAQESNDITRPPSPTYHPAWSILGQAINLAIPAYAGIAMVDQWGDVVSDVTGTIASMDRADNSISIGGDQIGGDRIDDRSVAIGGDQIGGDRIDDRSVGGDQVGGDNHNGDDVGRDLAGGDIGDDIGRDNIGGDWRSGDDVSDGCIGDACRSTSDGPIDNSNPGDDNNDNSVTPPPAPPPEG